MWLPKKAIKLRDTGLDRQGPASGHRNVKSSEDVGRTPTVSAVHAKEGVSQGAGKPGALAALGNAEYLSAAFLPS